MSEQLLTPNAKNMQRFGAREAYIPSAFHHRHLQTPNAHAEPEIGPCLLCKCEVVLSSSTCGGASREEILETPAL